MARMGKSLGLAVSVALTLGQVMAADPLRVASKVDTEGALLGNMLIALLEDAGYPVENKLQLGPTNIVRTALLEGEIDLYPEYTGNGAFFSNTTDDKAWKDAEAGYRKVRDWDREKNGIVWLEPAPANNTWAIAVKQSLAEKNDLSSMADFSQWVNDGGGVKLAASAEFVESQAALPSFQEAYGFTLSQDQLLVLSGGNTAATIRAAAEGTSGTNAAMVYGTDGAIKPAGLKVMEDTQGVQMVYEPTVAMREQVLEANPQLPELFEPVLASLDRETLQELNSKIQVDGLPAKQVARDYLEANGFLD